MTLHSKPGFSFKTFAYKNHVLLAFSKQEFLELFGNEKLEFEVSIVNNKIILASPEIKIGLPMKHTPSEIEVFTDVC